MRKEITDTLKQNIIKYYKSSAMPLKQVSKKFDLSLPTIIKILKDVPKYTKAQIHNPNMKEDYFSTIDTEEKAYFIGLLITDGNVFIDKSSSNRSPSISITLQDSDNYILNRFKEELNTNTSVNSDGRGCSQIAIRSNQISEDLSRFGMVPNKSFHTFLPDKQISEEFMPALIRGILDGDGSVFLKLNRKKPIHSISFCGSNTLMIELADFIYRTVGLHTKPKVYTYKTRQLSEIKVQGLKDIYKLGMWIYGKNPTIFLKRKYQKFQEIIDYYTKHENPEVTVQISKG